MSNISDRRMKIKSMVNAGLYKATVIESITESRSTFYRDLSSIKKKEYVKKKYDSKNRFMLNSQDHLNIMQFLAFNKFTTLNEIISECKLECTSSTLSRYLKRQGIKKHDL